MAGPGAMPEATRSEPSMASERSRSRSHHRATTGPPTVRAPSTPAGRSARSAPSAADAGVASPRAAAPAIPRRSSRAVATAQPGSAAWSAASGATATPSRAAHCGTSGARGSPCAASTAGTRVGSPTQGTPSPPSARQPGRRVRLLEQPPQLAGDPRGADVEARRGARAASAVARLEREPEATGVARRAHDPAGVLVEARPAAGSGSCAPRGRRGRRAGRSGRLRSARRAGAPSR